MLTSTIDFTRFLQFLLIKQAQNGVRVKIGVLGSGKGSNFVAILNAVKTGGLDVDIRIVLSDCPQALILEKANSAAIPNRYIPPGRFKTYLEPEAENSYVEALRGAGVEWVVLAGFMRVLKSGFFHAYRGRIINIHPSLLPSFKGLEAWRQALEYGVQVTGCTVHFVDEGIDSGPIIMQRAVDVFGDDTAETLHARIQKAEHEVYPEALKFLSQSRYVIQGRIIKRT